MGVVEPGQAVQALGHIGMIGADVFLGYFEGFLGDNDGTVIFARTIKITELLIKDVPFNACALREHGRCGQQQEQKGHCNC